MKIYNAKVFHNGSFSKSAISFSDRIEGFEASEGIDARGAYIVPGFIDVHTHGAVGVDGSDCEEILQLIKEGKIDTTPLITHTYPLSRIEEAYRVFEEKEDGVIKIAVEA